MIPTLKNTNATLVPNRIRTLFGIIVWSIIIFTLLSLIFIFRSGINIDTNLKSLTPVLIENNIIAGGVDKLTSSAESRFIMVLLAESKSDIEISLNRLQALEPNYSDVFYTEDSTAALEKFGAFIKNNQFHLLSPSQVQQLSSESNEKIISSAQSRLYHFDTALSILPFTDDPMGYANTFALHFLHELSGNFNGEIQETIIEGRKTFLLPLAFNVRGNALDINQQKKIVHKKNNLVMQLTSAAPNIQILNSGIVFFAHDAAKNAQADISLISTGSMLGVLILMITVFRSVKPMILTTVSIITGVCFAFVLSHLLFKSVHILTIVFGASLIGVVVDYSLHYYYITGKAGAEKSLPALFRALSFSLITSIVGYSALSFSGLKMLQQVAFFSVIGLIGAWFIVVSLGPLFNNKKRDINAERLERLISKILFALRKIQYKKLFIANIALLAMAGFLAATKLTTQDNSVAFFTISDELLAQEKKVDRLLSTYEPASFIVVKANSEQEIYTKARILSEYFDESFFGAHQFIPSPSSQEKNYKEYERLYGDNGLALTFLKSLDVKQETIDSLENRYLSAATKKTPVATLTEALDGLLPPLWLEQEGVIYSFLMLPKSVPLKRLQNYVDTTDDISLIRITDASVHAVIALRESASRLLLIAIFFVGALLLFRFRRIQALVLLSVPLSSIALCIILFSVFGIAVSLFHIMAMFLILGLGMDYVIFATELSSDKIPTSLAITLSALTSLLSFGLLSLSSLPLVHAFGLTVLIGNTFNLTGAIMLSASDFSKQWTLINER